MSNAKTFDTPIELHVFHNKNSSELVSCSAFYRTLVGRLIYLLRTWLNFKIVSQFMSDIWHLHFSVVLHKFVIYMVLLYVACFSQRVLPSNLLDMLMLIEQDVLTLVVQGPAGMPSSKIHRFPKNVRNKIASPNPLRSMSSAC